MIIHRQLLILLELCIFTIDIGELLDSLFLKKLLLLMLLELYECLVLCIFYNIFLIEYKSTELMCKFETVIISYKFHWIQWISHHPSIIPLLCKLRRKSCILNAIEMKNCIKSVQV